MTDTHAAAVTPHPVPDPLGVNRFDADPVLALARSADKHPPTPAERCLPALTTQLFDELQPGAMLVTQQGAGRHPCDGGEHGMAAFAAAGRRPRAYFAPCTHTPEAHA